MGVFDTLFTSGPLGCAQSFGTAFVYGAGNQSATNDYNISPGSPNSAWRDPVTQLDCNVEYSTVGGGPSGFGVLEDNLGTSTTVYHRFNQATGSFSTPPVTVAGHGELDPALSQDGSGGIYATYLLGGGGGPINLSYSADGGKSFASAPINADHDGSINNVTSAVNGQGQGWATWIDNGSVYGEPFQASDAIVPPVAGGNASSNGQTVSLNVSCSSYPCTITITLTAPSTVVIHAAAARKAKRRVRTLTLGRERFLLTKAGSRKLTVKLSSTGRKFLGSRSGRLKVSGVFTELLEHHTAVTKRTLTLTVTHRHRR
jgi:hypothetical protein